MLSALLDSAVRVLHGLQALIYVAVIVPGCRDAGGGDPIAALLWKAAFCRAKDFLVKSAHDPLPFEAAQEGHRQRGEGPLRSGA